VSVGYTCTAPTGSTAVFKGGWCEGNQSVETGPAPVCRQCPTNYASLPPQQKQKYFGCF
jgi:hypothetical protein